MDRPAAEVDGRVMDALFDLWLQDGAWRTESWDARPPVPSAPAPDAAEAR